ncbi:MAG: 50S ribosomal protein L4 [Candidatus Omnitrophica bacterium]|nr:50S ribosomal protein L4 [Candidatus Omnitrophota bacterium]
MPKLTVFNIDGKETGLIELPADFAEKVNTDVIHQAVVMYQANERQGTLDTKIRSEISGGNKKPFRQKGTGRARQGSSRSPLMHHGGIVFGPHQRDFSYVVPKKVRIAALKESLKSKINSDSLRCVDAMMVNSGKTKDFVSILKTLNISGKKVLALFDDCGKEVTLASRNVAFVRLVKPAEVNALDILRNNKILATKAAIEKILKRLQ